MGFSKKCRLQIKCSSTKKICSDSTLTSLPNDKNVAWFKLKAFADNSNPLPDDKF